MSEIVTALPPTVVTNLLDLHPSTAHTWGKLAQDSWTRHPSASEG